jgi:probable F420-dependent oxidoreductase
MTVQLGRYGIWRPDAQLTPALAAEVERLGYGAIWVGGSPDGDLAGVESLLAATDRIAVATGIVNMWKTPAAEVAASYHRLEAAYPGRFLLGVGIGHPEATSEYRSPYATMVDYLDELDAADVPLAGRALAALGPRALRLSADRSAGAHPYFTPVEHTREARGVLGEGPLLAPEQTVVVDPEAATARPLARTFAQRYLGLRNYRSNLERLGWEAADLDGSGSDALLDAVVPHGDAAAVAARLTAHLDAGADHVCVQVLTETDAEVLPALRGIAAELGLG